MSSQKCCFAQEKECNFLISIIDSFKRLLPYINTGKFGQIVMRYLEYVQKVTDSQVVTLSVEGYVMFIYAKLFKESYPSGDPTAEQIEKINAIWDAIGVPEKKLV